MIKKTLALFLLFALILLAQKKQAKPLSDQEQEDLQEALSTVGSSPVEFIRAIEGHLKRYPDSPRKVEMYRGVVKAAAETRDHRRVVEYGQKVLETDPNDILLLQVVAGGMLKDDDKANAPKALEYAKRLEKAAEGPEFQGSARATEEGAELLATSYTLQARATGLLGKFEEAASLARKSYELNPTADSARETSRWLQRAGKDDDAIRWLAEAFAYPSKAQDPQRGHDRQKMGEMYSKLHGSEKGLGDVMLEAYDRTAARLAERQKKLKELDPNADATDPLDFTISSVKGEKLNLGTLKGKVVVMDFWATWCGPCRAQHPLYAEVKKRFADTKDVVFLSINTDEDRTSVESFLEENKWEKNVYYEDGMASALRISSIPTAMVLNKKGEVVSRLNGFLPDRFVEMMTARIREALK